MAEGTALAANRTAFGRGREPFAKARRSGYPAWLWPDVPVENWRSAVDAIVDVARKVLASGSKPSLPGSDARALGLAGYTSGMGPLLGFWVESGIATAETEIAELFALHLSHNRRRMDRLFEVARETIKRLNESDISPLILKGMHTAFRYFPEPGLRPVSDIDMYIPMESMRKAERVFAELGYKPALRMRSPYACDWIAPSQPASPRTLTFVHQDVHAGRRLIQHEQIRFGNPLPCSERADWFPGRQAFVMRQPLLALYLAVHLSQTLLNVTVLRVLELAVVVRRDFSAGRLDWNAFLRAASAMGGLRFAYPALSFVAQLGSDIIPHEVMAAAIEDAPANLREAVGRLTIASAQPLDRHSVSERFMWAGTAREGVRQIASEVFVDGQGRPFRHALYSIGSKLWALGRGRYSP